MWKEVVAYHGWGFDRTCWRLWSGLQDLQLSDRGYFNAPQAANGRIIFAHSYGLHQCPLEQLQQAEALVLFNSFLSFHPQQGQRRSQGMLAQMMTQFEINPQQVLSNFRAKCYHPLPWETDLPAVIHADLLLQDLKALDTCSLEISILKQIPRILILQGAQDRIVSPSKGRELFQDLPDNSQYIEVEQAGHGLPFTHPEICQSWIVQRLGTA